MSSLVKIHVCGLRFDAVTEHCAPRAGFMAFHTCHHDCHHAATWLENAWNTSKLCPLSVSGKPSKPYNANKKGMRQSYHIISYHIISYRIIMSDIIARHDKRRAAIQICNFVALATAGARYCSYPSSSGRLHADSKKEPCLQSSNGLVRVLQRDANLAGSQKVLRHDSFTVFNISLPPSLLPLYNVQCIYPVWPFFSSNLKLATNQICFGFSLWGEIYLFGLHYVVWIAFEAVLFDADQLFLQSLPLGKGKTWFWLMTKKHIAKAYASITSMEHDNRYGPGALLVVLVVQVWH